MSQSGHYLNYFESKEAHSNESLRASLDVRQMSQVDLTQGIGLISITLKDSATIKLRAPSDKVAAEWAAAIQAAMDAPAAAAPAADPDPDLDPDSDPAPSPSPEQPSATEEEEQEGRRRRKGTLGPPAERQLERYLGGCGDGEIVAGLVELDPKVNEMLKAAELEWHKSHPHGSTFYHPSWKQRLTSRAFQSEHLRKIFVDIVGQQIVPGLEKNEWKEGTDTSKRMGTAPMSINDLLRQLERNVGAHPYFFGGFVRDMIVGVMANDIDLSLANTYDELQIIMQWVDSKNWLHSIDSKRTVTLEEAVKEGWKKAKHPDYLNYVSKRSR